MKDINPRVKLREATADDYAWVVRQNGKFYFEALGWDKSFENLCQEIVDEFENLFDPQWHRMWIAEVDGTRAGTAFCISRDQDEAILRLLLVLPEFQGFGIGNALVGACVKFAEECGYARMTLWTQSTLTAARNVYSRFGFKKIREETHHSFGHDLVGEYWELNY